MAGKSIFSGGKGLFTAWDPASALRANPRPTWVAVLPDKMTPELNAQFKQAGIAVVIWEPKASQAGVDAVKAYGAAGYIAQAEGPEELAAAQQFGSQITVPKALVSNNFMPAYPPGWIAMPEAYTNNNPNATADQVTRDALARGATEVVPVIGLGFVDTPGGKRMTAAEYQAGLDRAGAAGASGSAAYIAEQTSDEDLNTYTSGKVPSGATPPDGGGGGATTSGGQPAPPQSPPGGSQTPPAPPAGAPPTPPPVPPPAYGTTPPGPQMAEGGLGENWNLGWLPPMQHASSDLTHPYSFGSQTFGAPSGGVKSGGGSGFGNQPPPPDATAQPGTQPPPAPDGDGGVGVPARVGANLYLTPHIQNMVFQRLPYLNQALRTLPPYNRGF